MKKLFCLLLAAVMCFGLCACKNEEQPVVEETTAEEAAIEEATALMEQGRYEEAIARLSSVKSYARISSLIASAESKLAKEQLGFAFGTWCNLEDGQKYTFHEDGTVTMDFTAGTARYSYDNGDIILDTGLSLRLTVKEKDGITCLTGGDLELVKEADYAAVGPQEVEITAENWEDYFELRPVTRVSTDASGEFENRWIGYGIFLRDEYMDELIGDVDVSFGVQYDLVYYYVEGDIYSGDFDVTDEKTDWDEKAGKKASASVCDYRGESDMKNSDFEDSIAADFTHDGIIYSNDGECVVGVCENFQVVKAQGTMKLHP
ncbi:MAG: hypothetical protein ACI3V5_05800 [Faecousia sp.]